MSASDLISDALKASARTQTPVSTDALTASVDGAIEPLCKARMTIERLMDENADLCQENTRLRQLVACYRAATLKDITR